MADLKLTIWRLLESVRWTDRTPLPSADAGMCARQRSHFRSLRRKKVTKERATPLSVSPSLRFGATCGARRKAGSAQTRFAQTARGPDPLCACAPRHGQRGWGAKQRFGPSLRAACASAPQAAQALGSDHDFARGNSCSDPNPGTVGAAQVLCNSCLSRRIQVPDNVRLLSARRCSSPARERRLFKAEPGHSLLEV